MSIADVFETGQHKQEKGHLINLILIALADGMMEAHELACISKMASRYGITPLELKALFDNPKAFSINPPIDKETRYKDLLELVGIANIDGAVAAVELQLLEKFAVGIGFPIATASQVVALACTSVQQKIGFDEVATQIDQLLGL